MAQPPSRTTTPQPPPGANANAAPGPSTSTATAGVRPARPPAGAAPTGATIQTIMQNLPNLFIMQAKGSLSELQIHQLRQLMHTHYREVISSSISQGRPNPLLSLPPDIDPSLPYKNRPPLIGKDEYLEAIRKHTTEIREMMVLRAQSVKAAQEAGTATPPAPPPISTPAPTVSTAASSVGPTPTPTPTPTNIMSYQTLVSVMKLSNEARNEWLSKEPDRRILFQVSAKYWTKHGPGANRSASPAPSAQNQASSSTTSAPTQIQARPPPSSSTAPASSISTTQAQAPPPAQTPSTTQAQPPQTSVPAPPPAPPEASAPPPSTTTVPPIATPSTIAAQAGPMTGPTPAFAVALPDMKQFALRPPPPPPEPEPVRRRRKWKEFVDELAPGLEMELGVDEVLGDLLDSLIDEGVKGATRLAKHRGSKKVELKDMAFFVDQNWGTTVPGFDALPHRHIHVAPEREKKRGRVIAPRAGRLGGRGKDDE